ELYDHLKANDKFVFVNADDALQAEKTSGMQRIMFSVSGADAQLQFTNVEAKPFVSMQWGQKRVESKLIGTYNAVNIGAAFSAGHYFEIPANDIIDAIGGYEPSNNRSQIVKTNFNEVVLDAYNA